MNEFDGTFAVLANGEDFFADDGPGAPTGKKRNGEAARGHEEVRADEVEEVEEIAPRNRKAAPGPEREGRDRAEEEERNPVFDKVKAVNSRLPVNSGIYFRSSPVITAPPT